MAIIDNAAIIVDRISIANVLFILLFGASVDVAIIVILAFVGFVLGFSCAFGIVGVGVADVVCGIGTDITISACTMVRFFCWYWYCSEAKIINIMNNIIWCTKAVLALIIEIFMLAKLDAYLCAITVFVLFWILAFEILWILLLL